MAVAAEASPSSKPVPIERAALAAWLTTLPALAKDELLMKLLEGESVQAAMERQIRETLTAVIAIGVKRILFRDDRVNSTKWKPSEWGLGDKRLRRSQIVIAKTELEASRGLIKDWSGKAMKYPEDNVILTQTRKRADVLNKAAQKRRQKGGHIAKTWTSVGGIIVHQNDRQRPDIRVQNSLGG